MNAEEFDFVPIEEIAKKYNSSIEETTKILKQYSKNKQYFDYLDNMK